MKKFIASSLLATLLLSPTLTTFASSNIPVYYKGQQIQFHVPPVIQNGRTLVEFRPIFEAFGLTVNWDDATQTVTGTKDGVTIKLQIGSTTAYVNNQPVQLQVAPQIINGRTFVPLRFVGDASGENVYWHSDTRIITIEDQNNDTPTDLMTPPSDSNSNAFDASNNTSSDGKVEVYKSGFTDNNIAYVIFKDGLAIVLNENYIQHDNVRTFIVGFTNQGNSDISTDSGIMFGIDSKDTWNYMTIYDNKAPSYLPLFNGEYTVHPYSTTHDKKMFYVAFDTSDNLAKIKYQDSKHEFVFDVSNAKNATKGTTITQQQTGTVDDIVNDLNQKYSTITVDGKVLHFTFTKAPVNDSTAGIMGNINHDDYLSYLELLLNNKDDLMNALNGIGQELNDLSTQFGFKHSFLDCFHTHTYSFYPEGSNPFELHVNSDGTVTEVHSMFTIFDGVVKLK
jgi:hypothetical protein